MPETGDIRIHFEDIGRPQGGVGYAVFHVRASANGDGINGPITDAELEDLAERIKGSAFMGRVYTIDIENDMSTQIIVTEDRIAFTAP